MARGTYSAVLSSRLIVAAAVLGVIAGPALADVKAGVEAWEAGDFARAVAEWEGPAKAGDADALFNLAQAYRLGRGVAADSARAREYYAAASAKGHLKAADNYGLLLFQEGEQEKAMPLVRTAAERGDPRAQYVLGLAHFNGDYAPRDWVRAYALMTLANGAGLPQAAGALGQMDQYVPLAQRQQAQSLARTMDEDAASKRASALAAADLGVRPAAQPAVQAAAQPAARSAITPVAVPASSAASRAPRSAVAAAAPPPEAATAPVVARTITAPAPGATRVATTAVAAAPVAASRAATAAPAPAPAARGAGTWRVQLGAFGVAGNADRLWNKLAANPALAGTRKSLVPSGNVTRLLAVGFGSKAAAEQACSTLQQQGQACLVAGSS
jgi:cell division septation protein DedD